MHYRSACLYSLQATRVADYFDPLSFLATPSGKFGVLRLNVEVLQASYGLQQKGLVYSKTAKLNTVNLSFCLEHGGSLPDNLKDKLGQFRAIDSAKQDTLGCKQIDEYEVMSKEGHPGLRKFDSLWTRLRQVQLTETADTIAWGFSTDGLYRVVC